MMEYLLNSIDERLLSRITEPKFSKFPFPMNDVNDGRSIVFTCSIIPTLHYYGIVVVVGILINRFSTVVTPECTTTQFD